jgi:hypothetical protein
MVSSIHYNIFAYDVVHLNEYNINFFIHKLYLFLSHRLINIKLTVIIFWNTLINILESSFVIEAVSNLVSILFGIFHPYFQIFCSIGYALLISQQSSLISLTNFSFSQLPISYKTRSYIIILNKLTHNHYNTMLHKI